MNAIATPKSAPDAGRGVFTNAFRSRVGSRRVGELDRFSYSGTCRSRKPATWPRICATMMRQVSSRIINEVRSINRVTYDISPKAACDDRMGMRRHVVFAVYDHSDLKSASRLIHVSYPMQVLRTQQPGGRQVLQRLRRDIDFGTVPALRGGEPGNGCGLLSMPRRVAGEQARRARRPITRRRNFQAFAWPALSSDCRYSGSRGRCCFWLLRLPPAFAG